MNKLKKERVKMLDECIQKIFEVSKIYMPASPAWTLIQSSWGHLKSVHHLETETKFDSHTLGVKFHHEQKD